MALGSSADTSASSSDVAKDSGEPAPAPDLASVCGEDGDFYDADTRCLALDETGETGDSKAPEYFDAREAAGRSSRPLRMRY